MESKLNQRIPDSPVHHSGVYRWVWYQDCSRSFPILAVGVFSSHNGWFCLFG